MKLQLTNIAKPDLYRIILGSAFSLMVCNANAAPDQSDTTSDNTFRDKFLNKVVDGSHVHGRAAIYDFRRWHDRNDDVKKSRSTAYGGWLDLETGTLYGFSFGGEFVYSSNFYNPENGTWSNNPNLAAPDGSVNTLSALYVQYNHSGIQLRGGRQLVRLPFASDDRFGFNPRAFEGVTAIIQPLKLLGINDPHGIDKKSYYHPNIESRNVDMDGYMPLSASDKEGKSWKIFGAKFSRFKARGINENFVKGTNFYALNDTPVMWSVGTSYRQNTKSGNYIFQLYHHSFQEIENLEFVEGGYITPAFTNQEISPYVRAEYVRGDDPDNLTSKLANLNKKIESDIFGLKIGLKSKYVDASVQGNFSPVHQSAIGKGTLLHPYSASDSILYTDTMNFSIDDMGPGYAFGGSLDLKPGNGFKVKINFAWYHAKHGHGDNPIAVDIANDIQPGESCANNYSQVSIATDCGTQEAWGLDTGISYDFGKLSPHLSGLHVQDRLGVTHFNSGTPEKNFYDNRVRFYYTF